MKRLWPILACLLFFGVGYYIAKQTGSPKQPEKKRYRASLYSKTQLLVSWTIDAEDANFSLVRRKYVHPDTGEEFQVLATLIVTEE